jgi:hypothetical protein
MPLGKTNMIRKPFPSELEFFKKNPKVSGMATEDNAVIINPYSSLSDAEKQAVSQNETARVLIRTGKVPKPNFALTKEQTDYLDTSSYYKDAKEEDRLATIAARLFTGDPTSGVGTQEQKDYIRLLRTEMERMK